MEEIREKAIQVLREKDRPRQVEMLNQILEYLLISADHTGTLDITPFLVASFVAAPNDEVATARVIEQTELFKKIPALKDKAVLNQLIKSRPEGVKALIKLSEDAKEITVTFDLTLMTDIGNEFHGKVKASELDRLKVYQNVRSVFEYL